MLKNILLMPALFLIVLASLFINVSIHESAHYLVAENYGLSPSISMQSGVGFLWNSEPIAYTSYSGGTRQQDIAIALAGPLANLLAMLLGILAYRKTNSFAVQIIMLAFALVAFLSFASNIYPTAGADGYILFAK
ncbi:MAG TPA: hypothetical protein HA224_03490 [Nanoarchaeota archaeon]|nr:hypothetical protein [Nanoarchaeota archaeon]